MNNRISIKDKFINFKDNNDQYLIEFENYFEEKEKNDNKYLWNKPDNNEFLMEKQKPIILDKYLTFNEFNMKINKSNKKDIQRLNISNKIISNLKKENKNQNNKKLKDLFNKEISKEFNTEEKYKLTNNNYIDVNDNDLDNSNEFKLNNTECNNILNNFNNNQTTNSFVYKINLNKIKMKNKQNNKNKINFKAIKNSKQLYEKCIEIKNLKEDIFNKEKIKKEKEELKECTFIPLTNNLYNSLISDKFNDRQKRWIQTQNLKDLEKYKSTKEKELDECTFKPKTNILNKKKSLKNFFKRRDNWMNYLKLKKKENNKKTNLILKTNKNYKKIIPNYLKKEKKDIDEINNLIKTLKN